MEGAAQVRCVCTCLLCDVEELLHPQLKVLQLLATRHRAAQTTTGSWKKAHALDLPADHGVSPTVIRIGADGSPEDMISCVVALSGRPSRAQALCTRRL